jgi:hypothetical protein
LLGEHFAAAAPLASVLAAVRASRRSRQSHEEASMRLSQPPFRAPQPATLLEAALDYASRGIAVLPCHHPVELAGQAGPWEAGRLCSCGRLRCPAPALHPIGLVTAADATVEAVDVVCWWAATPGANIATPAGVAVDVVEVHHPAPSVALVARLTELGVEPGPVIRAGRGCTQFLVAAGSTESAPPRPDDDEVVLVPAGSLLFLPPSRLADGQRVTWVRRLPDAARLPPADRLLPAVVEAVTTVVAL